MITEKITPSLDGKIWLKSIKHPFLNRPIKLLDRGQDVIRENRTAVLSVGGRPNPTSVSDVMGGQQFTHYIMTEGPNHQEEARNIDLTLTAGDVFFIHVPANTRAPGGYVVITNMNQGRLYYGSDDSPHVFEIECRVVNPPGPNVIGTVLTWGTIFNLYGSWAALIAANPTWADVVENVGSPEDVFAL